VDAPETRFLVDCGATSLVAMRKFGESPNSIDAILLTHLHGDHFGGVPFFLLDAQFVSRRTRPLLIAGPPGTRKRIEAATEVLYPHAVERFDGFAIEIRELPVEALTELGAIQVTPYPAAHMAGDPAYSLRVQSGGRTVTYTGDTAWTDALIPAASGVDLFITECNGYEKSIPWHMDYPTLMDRRAELDARRTLITHMGAEMLAASAGLEGEFAEDGLVLEL
jgi:ribonuclease BN (tRNA processing enzyme)